MKLAPLLFGLALASCASHARPPSEFGDPLYVNGHRVSDDEIKLALIYGPGHMRVDLCKTEWLIENEITRQARERSAGDPAVEARISRDLHAQYRIADEDFEAEYQHSVDDFEKNYPTLDLDTEVRRAFRATPWYREYLRQQMHFDRVFLPDDPSQWPATSVEAIRADPNGGELLIPDAEMSYRARQKAAENHGGEVPREDPLYLQFLRQIVRDAALAKLTIRLHADGIDPHLALWVDCDGDGKPEQTVTIDELWKQVKDTLTETEIDDAKRWYITSLATHDRLERDRALLTPEEARVQLAQLLERNGTGQTQLEAIALQGYRFPSTEAFAEYYALRKAFERAIAPSLVDGPGGELSPALEEYFPRANRLMGLGMVDAEVLLVSAMDIAGCTWKPDGWNRARSLARDLRARYDQDPAPEHWSRLLAEACEYWDAPPPEHKTDCADRKNSGRFGPRYRNDLTSYVGESAYSEWVTGECITDRMFFDQEVGTVAGPFRGPLGWYLTRVNARTKPARPLDRGNPEHRQRLREDYVRCAFIQYSKEAVAQARVQGWKPL